MIYKWKKALRQLLEAVRHEPLLYIGGADTLPQPLSPEAEAEAIEKLAAGDEQMRSLLVERNLRLVVYIAKKFESSGVGIEDLISIGTIGLIKAVGSFDPTKNIKLATYASRCIENEILMYLRKTSAQKCELSFDEPLSADRDGNELLLSDILGGDEDVVFRNMEQEEDRRSVHRALDRLPPREREIIELRFGLRGGREHTQKEVADRLGISQSYISRLEKKIMAQLRQMIEV